MMTPVLPFAVEFTTDGTSTALSFDLTIAPSSLDLRGAQIVGVQNLAITKDGQPTVGASAQATLSGTVMTVTFPAAIAEFDANSALIVWGVSGLLQLQGAALPLTT